MIEPCLLMLMILQQISCLLEIITFTQDILLTDQLSMADNIHLWLLKELFVGLITDILCYHNTLILNTFHASFSQGSICLKDFFLKLLVEERTELGKH